MMTAFLCALLAGCGGSSRYNDYDTDADPAAEDTPETARQAAYEELGANSDGTGADASNIDAYDVEDRGNYICTEDCSGHEAGFVWAQQNDFTDSSDCGGNSQSFIEGCEAFAEERQEQADSEAQEYAEEAAENASDEVDADTEYNP
jgi:hypothetical protein